jgi:hypothetical protein
MKLTKLAPFALCAALGACAAPPPSGPSVSAVAESNVSDQKFARDDSACRLGAQAATAPAAAVGGQFGVQGQYDSVYSDCMLQRGYAVSEHVPRYAYGPGIRFYGPGPYAYGPTRFYSWGWGVGASF